MSYEGSLSTLERQYRDWLSSAKTLLEAHDYRTAFSTYPFVRNEHAPWAPVAKPLHESLVALVSTGGFYVRGVQPARAHHQGDVVAFQAGEPAEPGRGLLGAGVRVRACHAGTLTVTV